MSVRKRIWGKAKNKEAWIVDFFDAGGTRRLKTFQTKREADRFQGTILAIGAGLVPEPLTSGYRPLEFSVPFPPAWKKIDLRQSLREAIATAARAAHPTLDPTTDSVIIHVTAEMPPSPVVADVDNLLKPILDALKGVAWVDDTQVCEVLCRRIPARGRHLRVKIWQIPQPVLVSLLNAFAPSGHPATKTRPDVT
jgi:Holliday junction resolvase RusA-like endonuclease